MANSNIKLILLIFALFHSYKEVEGRKRLSKTKDNILSKLAVKSIQTKYGDIYDCIDFYKQPSFDHPLLQNHTYNSEVRPYSYPKGLGNNGAPIKASKILDIWTKGKGCPVGTVPIRRTSKYDHIKAKKLSKPVRLTPTISGHVHAVVRTTNPNKKYNGARAAISIHNPHVFHTNQYSSGQMKIQNGDDSIQVGWTVNPTLYGDNLTRFFTYLNAGQSHCFNLQCPGFIISNTNFPIDYVFDTVSRQGGPIYDCNFFIYRDLPTGDWWLKFGSDDTLVGFWPKRIFTGLGDLASYVDWGGEVYSPPNEVAPYMGSGHLVYGHSNHDAFCRLMQVVNEAHWIVDATDTERYVNNLYHYDVKDYWGKPNYWGHLVMFGGGLWRDKN